jgi:hypothetical protein
MIPICHLEIQENLRFFFITWVNVILIFVKFDLRATSHMRLRARDHYTSSTLIGGKGGAGPSSLYNTLEGPVE